MEAAFGADLRAVRVHRDAAADRAARAEAATAFTSGSEIYFRSGAFAPERSSGRALLAHELAHVVQQTGRRDSSRRQRATPLRGSGRIQREADDFVDRAAKYDLFDPIPSWDATVKTAHSRMTDFAAHAATLDEVSGQTAAGTDEQKKALAELTRAPGFKPLAATAKSVVRRCAKSGRRLRAGRRNRRRRADVADLVPLPAILRVSAPAITRLAGPAGGVGHVHEEVLSGRFVAVYGRSFS